MPNAWQCDIPGCGRFFNYSRANIAYKNIPDIRQIRKFSFNDDAGRHIFSGYMCPQCALPILKMFGALPPGKFCESDAEENRDDQ